MICPLRGSYNPAKFSQLPATHVLWNCFSPSPPLPFPLGARSTHCYPYARKLVRAQNACSGELYLRQAHEDYTFFMIGCIFSTFRFMCSENTKYQGPIGLIISLNCSATSCVVRRASATFAKGWLKITYDARLLTRCVRGLSVLSF